MKTNKNLLILALTLVVVMLGYGMVMPILPFYIEDLGAGGTELGLLVASYAAMRLVFGPIWGSYSDRVGRKPIMMIGVLGYGVTMVLFGLSTKLWMLFAARTFSGILSSATSPTTMAYVSDSTQVDERSRGMGILGAAAGLGTILGPGLGGLLAGSSLSLPFFIAGGLSFVSVLLIGWLLPESLPAAQRQTAKQKTDWRSVFLNLKQLFHDIWAPMLLAFIMTWGMMMFFNIFGLYAEDKFAYGPEEVGIVFMIIGFVMILGQGVLTGPLTKIFGEVRLTRLSLLISAIGLFSISLAWNNLSLMVTIGIFTLASVLLIPAVTSLISKQTTLEQGFTMGWSNSVISLGRIVGPIVSGIAFDFYIEAPNFIGAALLLCGFVASLAWLKPAQDSALVSKPAGIKAG